MGILGRYFSQFHLLLPLFLYLPPLSSSSFSAASSSCKCWRLPLALKDQQGEVKVHQSIDCIVKQSYTFAFVQACCVLLERKLHLQTIQHTEIKKIKVRPACLLLLLFSVSVCADCGWINVSFKNFQKSNVNVANVQCFYHFKANIWDNCKDQTAGNCANSAFN